MDRSLEINDIIVMPPPSGITTSRVLPDAFHGRRLAASEYECKANRFAVTICCPPFSLVNRCRLTPFSLSLGQSVTDVLGSYLKRTAAEHRGIGDGMRAKERRVKTGSPMWQGARPKPETREGQGGGFGIAQVQVGAGCFLWKPHV